MNFVDEVANTLKLLI